ncbi:MAG: TatD family hydrolase [Cellvibrionaceae bacterium]
MLIDSHCHLDRLRLDKYDGQLSAAISMARERGVRGMLCVGISLDNREQVLDIAQAYPEVVASVGVHPLDIESGLATVDQLAEWSAHPKVVALGETGLDYYYSDDTKVRQQESFALHLQAAARVKQPVIVHTRSAKEDTLRLIAEHGNAESAGVLHCFTEDWDMAKRAVDMNYLISISGIVTFKNAEAIRDVVRKLPLDRLMVETDSPYLAPVPYRGKPNEPSYVREVAEYVAELKNISYSELIEITANNFFRLFPKAKLHIAS